MSTYVILVAGYEYHHSGTNMATICKNRANLLLEQNVSWRDNVNMKFILFDVRFGKIDEGTISGDTINWTTISDEYDAIDDSVHYTSERHFIEQETNVISIVDAYEYIQNIGKNNLGYVREFSVVGHGWRGGPVLVNSYERDAFKHSGSTPNLRDPWDKDGRRKDTNITNMVPSQWTDFINAFNEDSRVWVWGCAASQLYKKVIQKVTSSIEFPRKRYGSHSDEDTFSLSFSRAFAEEYFDYDKLFFYRSRTTGDVTSRRFTRTLREVKDFLIRGLCHTYSAQMAYNSHVNVYAALPGTGGDYERTGRANKRVMVVPTNSTLYGYSFTGILRFYKTYLSIQEDPDGKGYALYNPETINTWKGI
ncbi:hypothetical protein [Algibacter lectus]|uniref:hypothetical protein n=1 Tax=Algibacter lectus TaxID=221126 RepID=UPI0024949380|nr:hypothetical protein [Algibacter lectus]